MGVNCARENLAMPFMQWALGKTIPWLEITEILSPLWNKIDREIVPNSSPNKALVRTLKNTPVISNVMCKKIKRIDTCYVIGYSL